MMDRMGEGTRRAPAVLAVRSAGVFAGAWLVAGAVAWLGVILYGLGADLAGVLLGILLFALFAIGTVVYAFLFWVGWLIGSVRPWRARTSMVVGSALVAIAATAWLASELVAGIEGTPRIVALATVVLAVPAGCGYFVARTARPAHEPARADS